MFCKIKTKRSRGARKYVPANRPIRLDRSVRFELESNRRRSRAGEGRMAAGSVDCATLERSYTESILGPGMFKRENRARNKR
jgi:hypothetical protein